MEKSKKSKKSKKYKYIMHRFNYLLEKIKTSNIIKEPFEHIHIKDFLNDSDLNELINSSQIKIEKAKSDLDIINKLHQNDYEVIDFPGCITDIDKYVEWHSLKNKTNKVHSATSGFGLSFRLKKFQNNSILEEFNDFSQSEDFCNAMIDKFNLPKDNYTTDIGVQKFLDGYEISPHPGIRRKAVIFMFNINPHNNSEKFEHHTKLLKFKSKYKYIEDLWSITSKVERSWVPWDWCDVEKVQKDNNSIMMFSPNNKSLHADKADYNHLDGQRTLLYGNVWGSATEGLKTISWEHIEELRILRERNL